MIHCHQAVAEPPDARLSLHGLAASSRKSGAGVRSGCRGVAAVGTGAGRGLECLQFLHALVPVLKLLGFRQTRQGRMKAQRGSAFEFDAVEGLRRFGQCEQYRPFGKRQPMAEAFCASGRAQPKSIQQVNRLLKTSPFTLFTFLRTNQRHG